jgi:ribosome-binding protein aMBF1 (putative translation factor)
VIGVSGNVWFLLDPDEFWGERMAAERGDVTMPRGVVTGFGEALRELRLARGLTQSQLAAAAGVGVGSVRDLEQGRRARPRAAS